MSKAKFKHQIPGGGFLRPTEFRPTKQQDSPEAHADAATYYKQRLGKNDRSQNVMTAFHAKLLDHHTEMSKK